MNVLLIDVYSCFLDLAIRAQEAGHSVRWYQGSLPDGEKCPVGDGLVVKVNDWKSHMKWADLILLSDNVKYIQALEPYRKQGYPIFGPNMACTEWELNREVGQTVLRNAGVTCMDTIPFKSLREAQSYLTANPNRYVCKPNADDNKALSYVSKSARDMMFMLEKWQKSNTVKTEFIFQQFTPGIEVAVGAWVGRNGFVGKFLENFEHKKLMNGEVGVNTGEMGTVLKYVDESALAKYLLEPLLPDLIRNGYTGYIDVSVIVDKKGRPLPLEFTCRPGWPLQQILQCLHKGDPVQWMRDAIDGKDTMQVTDEVATGVVMSIPDFPYSKLKRPELCGYPVYGWEKIPERHFHPAEMSWGKTWELENGKLNKTNGYITAGSYVCVVTGAGKTVSAANQDAYKNLEKIELPNSPMYRTDIGNRLEKQLPKLQECGYCTDWTFE